MTLTRAPHTAAITVAVALASVPLDARAQQWSALDRVPRPYNVVAVDSSMTMAINGLGAWAPGGVNRLYTAKQILTGWGQPSEEYGAMYLFRDQFAFGGYSYSGSIEAHIKDGSGSLPHLGPVPNTVVIPQYNALQTSYVNTRNMINGLNEDYCLTTGKHAYNCLEQRLPGGATGPACITPSCANDRAIIEHLTQNPIAGLSVPTLPQPAGFPGADYPSAPTPWPDFTFPCDNMNPAGYPDSPTLTPLPVGCPRTSTTVPFDPSCPLVNITYELAHELGGSYYSWPRFSDVNGDGVVDVPPGQVLTDICQPLSVAFNKVQQKLNACMTSPPTLTPPFTCSHTTLAASLCATGSPFMGGGITPVSSPPITIPPTCVCDSSQPGCVSGGGNDDCGNPLYFPARQQVGICRSHDGARQPASTVATQPGDDNILRDPNMHTPSANPDLYCRANVATFVTDAGGAHPLGLATTSPDNAEFYFADFNVPQNNLITVGPDLPIGTMIQSVIRGVAPPSVASINGSAGGAVNALRSRFARDLNRSLKGVYAAAAPAMTQYQDRAAFAVMEVPGSATGAHLDYFGRPLRIEWWRVDPATGAPIARLFSTDEAARATVGATINGTRGYLGPSGTWRSGMSKIYNVPANTLDRDGDGSVDVHPPIRWGMANGGEGSRPVVVGAPLDAPEGSRRGEFAAWKRSAPIYERDRVAYALSNGYLHAYRVGRVSNAQYSGGTATSIGDVDSGIRYDDNPAAPGMGQEIFRYRPNFVELPNNASSALLAGTPRYNFNDVVQQPLIERGQLFVRDVQLTKPASPTTPARFATVLVMSQGSGGRGFAALDISDPNAPTVLFDDVLLAPGALALAAPAIYMWPDSAGGDPIPVLLAVGGTLTAPGPANIDRIYVYRLLDGALISAITLPRSAGVQRAWPNTPVCVDKGGAGSVDRCYVLAMDGTLAEVRVNPATGAFLSPTDVTPADPLIRSGGRVYTSGLTAYFTANNQLAFVFGSGDARRIERGDSTTNYVFKVVRQEGSTGPTTSSNAATVCRPNATLVDGHFSIGPGEMVLAPATVAKGTVAFSTYRPGATGCVDGQSYLYAFDFETCRDVIAPPTTLAKPAVGTVVGAGLPSSPVLLRRSGQLYVHTTAAPAAAAPVPVRTRGGLFEAVRPLFFRLRSTSK